MTEILKYLKKKKKKKKKKARKVNSPGRSTGNRIVFKCRLGLSFFSCYLNVRPLLRYFEFDTF